MPPRTRATKPTKILKENIGLPTRNKQRAVSKINKPTRKILGDKTNSASDDNTSVEIVKEPVKKTFSSAKLSKKERENDKSSRPRRDRRLPGRFAENQLLNNLSNKSGDNAPEASFKKSEKSLTVTINDSSLSSSFKTTQKVADSSLVANRPRRVCRLPSKLEDHSISPNKFIPVQPYNASTPLVQKSIKTPNVYNKPVKIKGKTNESTQKNAQVKSSISKDTVSNAVTKTTQNRTRNKQLTAQKFPPHTKNLSFKVTPKSNQKESPDTNNNPKERVLRARKVVDGKPKLSPDKASKVTKSPIKKFSPVKPLQRPLNKNFSFKILDDNEKKVENNGDVYEFTYDPKEEPLPKKKKRKVVKRKPAKPKTVVFKNNYEQNVNKALAVLKNSVARKQGVTVDSNNAPKDGPVKPQSTTLPNAVIETESNAHNIPLIQRSVASKIIIGNGASSQQSINNKMPLAQQDAPVNIISNKNVTGNHLEATNQTLTKLAESNKSVRVEDIAADFEFSYHGDFNYSPVNSPRPRTPVPQNQLSRINEHDPLNLRDNASFFDEQPVASSSMNMSVRHPQASPWRVEFESLPIRWHVNSYVKPNMTPAVECSFVNFDDKNKKKHVYTNLVPESNEVLPEIEEKGGPNLIQTSMYSFIKEAVERSSAKKKRGRSATPATPNLFTDTTDKTPEKSQDKNSEKEINKATRQLFTPKKSNTDAEMMKGDSSDKENSLSSSKGQKRKNDEEIHTGPTKTPRKEKDKTFFGFDDSENQDQENESPKKNVEGRKKSLRLRARAVLKEVNDQGPTRAVIPLATKIRNAEVEKLYDQMKSASDAPVLLEKNTVTLATATEPKELDMDEDSQSVHLFEDIELVHHLKPQRRSYMKAKKVTFRQNTSDSDTQTNDHRPDINDSDEGDDLNDLTFNPAAPMLEEKKTKKKLSKKQKMTKKEEEEADAWAAGFNSMCEDVEGFDLVVE